jgi:predicted Rossmann-fold nucleotide-binding protein
MDGVFHGALAEIFIRAAKTGKLPTNLHKERRVGVNIILPTEQHPGPSVGKLINFDDFSIRELAEMVAADCHLITPGGFGTLDEIVLLCARKTRGDINDPLLFGAPDGYFEKLNTALAPLLLPSERKYLTAIHHDPDKLVEAALARPGVPIEEPAEKMLPRMRADVINGLAALDSAEPAIAFHGGSGPRSKAAAANVTQLVSMLADKGFAFRLGGTGLDAAVMQGLSGRPEVQVQGFALPEHEAQDIPADASSGTPGVTYTQMTELGLYADTLGTRSKGMVFVADGAESMSVLYDAIVDQQTKKKPSFPLVVLDPDGKFQAFLDTAVSVMIDPKTNRKYINPEDAARIKVTNDPAVAAKYIIDTNAALDAADVPPAPSPAPAGPPADQPTH